MKKAPIETMSEVPDKSKGLPEEMWTEGTKKFLKENEIFKEPCYKKEVVQETEKLSIEPESIPVELEQLNDQEISDLLLKDFSDTENARRFLKLNGNTFLWIEDCQEWWHFDPKRPSWCSGDMAVRLQMKKTANIVNRLALAMPFSDDKKRLEKLKQCIAWKDASGIENSIKMLQDEGFARSNQFDMNPFLFLCKSGPINLKNGKIVDLKPSDYLHKMSPVILDPKGKCPQWIQFLNDTFLNNLDLIFSFKNSVDIVLLQTPENKSF